MLGQFHEAMDRILGGLGEHRDLDVVVGIPFHNEIDTLGGVVETVRAGLQQNGMAGRSVILCAGPERARPVFDAAAKKGAWGDDIPVNCLMLGNGLEGRGWSIRAIMVAATRFRAPLILLPPNLVPSEGDGDHAGFSPGWIERLLAPMDQDQDLALARFSRHPLAQPVESFLAYPAIAAVFGFRLRQPTPGVVAISQKLLHSCLAAPDIWANETGAYGFDAWLVTRALSEDMSVCEVPLGPVSFRHEVGKLKVVFHQVAHAVMSEVARQDGQWLDRTGPFRSASVSGPRLDAAPPDYDLRSDELHRRFKLEFNHFDETLYRAILPDDLRERMERQADAGASGNGVSLSADEWVLTLRRFLLAYKFETGFHPDDIVDGLFPFFLARLVTFIDKYHSMKNHLADSKTINLESARHIARHEAERSIQNQMEIFAAAWPHFRDSWQEREKEISPYLPRLGAWQFIPNVDVIVPQEIDVPDANSVWAYQVYKDQIDRYRGEFKTFISERLGIDDYTRSAEILEGVESFVYRLDRLLDTDVFPYDVTAAAGAQKMADKVCRHFVEKECFCLTSEAAEKILMQAPPRNVITQMDVDNVRGLLDRFGPRDALALAAWTDRHRYLARALDIIESDGQVDWFETAGLKPTVVDIELLSNTTEVGGSAALARLAGRVVVTNTPPGAGGRLPKLWYMLRLIKSIVGVELFSEVWRGFAEEGFDFGRRLVTSIYGHWGRQVMSAHNAFENRHQRIVVERLMKFASELPRTDPDATKAAEALAWAAGVYHLSITLPDATFVPLSAWTWASFSNRGGVGVPTPLSSLVERDWATADFLTSYLERTRLGDAATLDKKIVELIGAGKESEDLSAGPAHVRADQGPQLGVTLRTQLRCDPARRQGVHSVPGLRRRRGLADRSGVVEGRRRHRRPPRPAHLRAGRRDRARRLRGPARGRDRRPHVDAVYGMGPRGRTDSAGVHRRRRLPGRSLRQVGAPRTGLSRAVQQRRRLVPRKVQRQVRTLPPTRSQYVDHLHGRPDLPVAARRTTDHHQPAHRHDVGRRQDRRRRPAHQDDARVAQRLSRRRLRAVVSTRCYVHAARRPRQSDIPITQPRPRTGNRVRTG
jgi:hypothetical protein